VEVLGNLGVDTTKERGREWGEEKEVRECHIMLTPHLLVIVNYVYFAFNHL